MKKIILFATGLVLLTSCQESLEKRLQRENREYTEKNCPQKIEQMDVNGQLVTLWLDSIVFSPETLTLSHYFRISQAFDTDAQEAILLSQLKNDTKFVVHREHGYNFHYQYRHAARPDSILYEVTFSKDNY